MSLLYSIQMLIVRKGAKGDSAHREGSCEEFKRASCEIQRKFRFALLRIRDFEFRGGH